MSEEENGNEDNNVVLINSLLEASNEINALRSMNKHILCLGGITVEVIPSRKDNLVDVLKEFTIFSKKMKKIFGNNMFIQSHEPIPDNSHYG